jgi:hypothetical protein
VLNALRTKTTIGHNHWVCSQEFSKRFSEEVISTQVYTMNVMRQKEEDQLRWEEVQI